MIVSGPPDQKGINGGMIKRQGAIDGTAVIAYFARSIPPISMRHIQCDTIFEMMQADAKAN